MVLKFLMPSHLYNAVAILFYHGGNILSLFLLFIRSGDFYLGVGYLPLSLVREEGWWMVLARIQQ